MKYTFEQEVSMPENMKQTHQNQIKLQGLCYSMERALRTIESRVNGIPLLDDEKHAELVKQFHTVVKEAEKALWKAAEFGVS